MQKARNGIVYVGIALVFAMIMFPPWSYVDGHQVGHPMGYGPIWQPPVQRQRDTADLFGVKLQLDLQSQTANTIDLVRLLIQIAVLATATGGAAVLLKEQKA